jgi:serine/threonine protein kinase
MSDATPSEGGTPLTSDRIDAACESFESAWKDALAGGTRPHIEDHLANVPETHRAELLRELVLLDLHYRGRAGEQPGPENYRGRFPELGEQWLARQIRGRELTGPKEPPSSSVLSRQFSTSPVDFEILGELGQGGMGVVFKARQVSLNRLVALKFIQPRPYAGADDRRKLLRRFQTEAEALAQLQHPQIVQIHTYGEQNGIPYFAMELVDGENLETRLRRERSTPHQSAALLESLASVIHYAHGRGIVHRDLKPSNILLTSRGIAKITDFGLAKILRSDQDLTASNAIMGTPSYMAPEQASGDGSPIGPPADVYALGAILYHLLTGQPPFTGHTSLEILDKVRFKAPARPNSIVGDLPADLEVICLRCLEKSPGWRYLSAEELAQDLRTFLSHGKIRVRSYTADADLGAGPTRAGAHCPSFNPPTVPGYEVLEEWARGFRTVVYRAQSTTTGQIVALKLMSLQQAALLPGGFPLGLQTRFRHPNVVDVYLMGPEEGFPFVVMEFMEGGNLRNVLDGGPMQLRSAVELLLVVSRALHALHRQGILHCNLKPENILFTAGRVPKIADARQIRLITDQSHPREPYPISGTPVYFAPEQVGWWDNQLRPSTDVYAVGVVMYELLTGCLPFQVTTLDATLNRIRWVNPGSALLSSLEVPCQLIAICQRCLQKDPDARYATAQQLAQELQHFLDGRPLNSTQEMSPDRGGWARVRDGLLNLLPFLFLMPGIVMLLMIIVMFIIACSGVFSR